RGADDSRIVIKDECFTAQWSGPHAQPPLTSQLFAESDEDPHTQANREETHEPHDIALLGRGNQETVDRIEQEPAQLASNNAAHQRSTTLCTRAAEHVHAQAQRAAKDGPGQTSQNDESDKEPRRPGCNVVYLGNTWRTRQYANQCEKHTRRNESEDRKQEREADATRPPRTDPPQPATRDGIRDKDKQNDESGGHWEEQGKRSSTLAQIIHVRL